VHIREMLKCGSCQPATWCLSQGSCENTHTHTHTHGPSYAREYRKFDIADACVGTLRRDGWRSFRQQNYLFVIKATKFVTFLDCYTSCIRANTWHCPRPMSVWAKIGFLFCFLDRAFSIMKPKNKPTKCTN